MKTVCEIDKCTGCASCKTICPREAITIQDNIFCMNAVINDDLCIHCDKCERVCQVNHPLHLNYPIKWYQGWCKDKDDRRKSSSGGFAYVLSKQIISENGLVASCEFFNGQFTYTLSESFSQLDNKRGSKYVKSNPTDIYKLVLKEINAGRLVLFIGLPCHVAALKNYVGREYDNLFTVDLICHGSPSPKLLELFLQQYGFKLSSFKRIRFRDKTSYKLGGVLKDNTEISFTEASIKDRYSLGFLKGLFYTENCYSCVYATQKRMSDLTIGDSWGSELSEDEKHKGISLVLCLTEKGKKLIERCEVDLATVDIDKALAANHQLREPSIMPKSRRRFFEIISKGTAFNKAVFMCYPKTCVRSDIKNLLIKIGFLNSSRG